MADFSMYRGDTELLQVQVVDNLGAPYDLTGCKMWMTAKLDIDDPDIDAVFISESGTPSITFTDEDAGQALIEIFPADTNTLVDAVTLVYDVQILDADDRVFTVAVGNLVILEDVTRDFT